MGFNSAFKGLRWQSSNFKRSDLRCLMVMLSYLVVEVGEMALCWESGWLILGPCAILSSLTYTSCYV